MSEKSYYDAFAAYTKMKSPEVMETEQIKQGMAAQEAEANQQRTDELLKNSNLVNTGPDKESYDYEAFITEGGSAMPQDDEGVRLPNRYRRPLSTVVAGRDLVTGEKQFNPLNDFNGYADKGVSMLRDSHVNTQTGPPVSDIRGLSRIAYSVIEQYGGYEEFSQQCPRDWTEMQKRIAFQTASNVYMRKGLEKHFNDARLADQETGQEPAGEDIDPVTLPENADWLKAARTVYQGLEGKQFQGTDDELSEYALWQMAMFNYNTGAAAMMFTRTLYGNDDFKQGMMHLIETFDHVNVSMGGVGRGTVAVLSDPVGMLGMAGGAISGRIGARGAKTAMRELVKGGMAGAVGESIVEAPIAAAEETMRQQLEVETGRREEISPAEVATAGVVGGGIAAAMGGVLGAGATDAAQQFAGEMIDGARKGWKEIAPDKLLTNEIGAVGHISDNPRTMEEVKTLQVNIGDPINRPFAKKAVKELEAAGLKPIMFRGNLATAKDVAHSWKDRLDDESKDFIRWVDKQYRRFLDGKDEQYQSVIHFNGKTGLSLDFSTNCPRRMSGLGACPYCYVETARVAKDLKTEYKATGGKKGADIWAGHAKKRNMESVYQNEILAMPANLVNALNADGGLRMFSFGDFRPDIDDENLTQVLKHAKQKGLYIKAITKERELVERFGDHPNLRINISVDTLPQEMTNAPRIEEAVKWQAGRSNIKIRGVAFTPEQINQMGADPRISVITAYHGKTGDSLWTIIQNQNPALIQRVGEARLKQQIYSWQNMKVSKKLRGQISEEAWKKMCCQGSKCSRDKTKCGFGLGAVLIGIHLPETDYEDNEGPSAKQYTHGA